MDTILFKDRYIHMYYVLCWVDKCIERWIYTGLSKTKSMNRYRVKVFEKF